MSTPRKCSYWNISLVSFPVRGDFSFFQTPKAWGKSYLLRNLEGRPQMQLNYATASSTFPPAGVPSKTPYKEHQRSVCKWIKEWLSQWVNASVYGPVFFLALLQTPKASYLLNTLCLSFRHFKVNIQVSSSHHMVILAMNLIWTGSLLEGRTALSTRSP